MVATYIHPTLQHEKPWSLCRKACGEDSGFYKTTRIPIDETPVDIHREFVGGRGPNLGETDGARTFGLIYMAMPDCRIGYRRHGQEIEKR